MKFNKLNFSTPVWTREKPVLCFFFPLNSALLSVLHLPACLWILLTRSATNLRRSLISQSLRPDKHPPPPPYWGAVAVMTVDGITVEILICGGLKHWADPWFGWQLSLRVFFFFSFGSWRALEEVKDHPDWICNNMIAKHENQDVVGWLAEYLKKLFKWHLVKSQDTSQGTSDYFLAWIAPTCH